ncbi:MAG TPA: hypothetical protein PLS58_06520 [Bacteroidales bacterium]|nr:hypothetical protein [Bacteroidales bacterium]
MYFLVLPLGIINLILVALQILGGLKIVKIPFRWHRNLGIALGVFALLHASIALIYL